MFNVIPNNIEEINNINPSLEKLYNHIVKNFNIINPFAFDLKKPKTVKICRIVAYKLNLSYWKKLYSNLVLKIGDGTRSENKGIKFEKGILLFFAQPCMNLNPTPHPHRLLYAKCISCRWAASAKSCCSCCLKR
jgi:hypothetical protein